MPRIIKRLLALGLDIILCIFSVWLALSLLLEIWIPLDFSFIIASLISVGVAIPIFFSWGLYRAVFRYSGERAFRILAKATLCYTVIYFVIFSLILIGNVPRSFGLMQPMILFILIGLSRWSVKICLGKYLRGLSSEKNKKNV
ncbi:polysaccharide biosynthesis protein, partial [Alphaproteobacteria bacterium]|nr:polysaccharide biosynthesis protein [Alphaproteobacteria bacterium]